MTKNTVVAECAIMSNEVDAFKSTRLCVGQKFSWDRFMEWRRVVALEAIAEQLTQKFTGTVRF